MAVPPPLVEGVRVLGLLFTIIDSTGRFRGAFQSGAGRFGRVLHYGGRLAPERPAGKHFPALQGRRAVSGALLLPVLALCCCGYLRPGVPVRVLLPAERHPWERAGAVLPYTVSYLDREGRVRFLHLEPGCREAEVLLSRRICNPVAARPAGRLPAAGGFAGPANWAELLTGRRSLQLSWRDGAAAELLQELASAGAQPDVDGPALSVRMESEGEGDPHRCRTGELRAALGYGFFSLYHVTALPLQEVVLPEPTESWIPGNPLLGSGAVPAASGAWKAELYDGVHAFYDPGGDMVLCAAPDGEGGTTLLLEPLRDFIGEAGVY